MTTHLLSLAGKRSKRKYEVCDVFRVGQIAQPSNEKAIGKCILGDPFGKVQPRRSRAEKSLYSCKLEKMKRPANRSCFVRRDSDKCNNDMDSSFCVNRRAHTSPSSSWEQGVLRRLYTLLQDLSPTQRHAVLAKRLSESQRLKLERWMLAQRLSPTRSSNLAIAVRPLQARARVQCKSRIRIFSSRAQSECDMDMDRGPPRRNAFSRAASQHNQRLRGIVRHMREDTKECYYSVSITVGRLRLLTREDRNYDVVKSYRDALSILQQRMAGVEADSFELAFRCHVKAVLEEHGLEVKAMGLRFCVCLAALWLPRPLLTSPFGMEGEALDAGLDAWRRLGEARGRILGRGSVLWVSNPEEIARSWERVRATYLDIMEEAGHCRDHIVCKLAGFEAKQHAQQEVQLRRWNCAKMAAEEKQQRRFLRQEASKTAEAAAISKKQQQAEGRMLNAIAKLLVRWEWKSACCNFGFVGVHQSPFLQSRCQNPKKKLQPATRRALSY